MGILFLLMLFKITFGNLFLIIIFFNLTKPFFNASIAGEYEVMKKLGLSDDELKSLTTNAVEHAFCDEDTKSKLLNKI